MSQNQQVGSAPEADSDLRPNKADPGAICFPADNLTMRIALAILAATSCSGGALAQVPSPASAPDRTPSVAPLRVHPLRAPSKEPPPDATVDVPMDDTTNGAFASVWPRAAYEARIPGKVTLSCEIDRHGLAERCEVDSETPPGKGFGDAALQLRPTFKLAPAHDASGPVDSWMRIAIAFTPPHMQVSVLADSGGQGNIGDCGGLSKPCPEWHVIGTPLPRRNITMIDNPVWVAAPTFADVAQAYPVRARGVEGYAVAHCEVMRSGALTNCQVTKEAPDSHGFGNAAAALAEHKFKVDPAIAGERPRDDLWVDVPIRFPSPSDTPDRKVAAPRWVAGFDPDAAVAVYPPEAVARGVTNGRGTARCIVAPGGALIDCAAQPGDPDGLGFSEAAVKLAQTMRMNPWTADAAPVDGASVDVAIRLNLKSP
jgi:TonB family protein